MRKETATAATIRAALNYDLETGILTWRHRSDVRKEWNTRFAGKRAGYTPDGRNKINFGGSNGRPHLIFSTRVIWIWMTGEWPDRLVDHIDGDTLNDRWLNLRLATSGQNRCNSIGWKKASSPYKGVSRHTQSGKWVAQIEVSGKAIYLGIFKDQETAAKVYAVAALKHYGEFARTA